ncbi:type IV peptidase [Streptomyces albus]|uniref:Type IV peptidase n=1 Tax=Streptomyces albus (strain ATCC 21838 / DSM 41398 / FERM P-419 / JCM 4703 / NBRC 107858) TaxID=1081613 RepID=A0A0B5EY76_STRA4|nr:type IV peptidase [Streptomyces albus]AOU77372.1 type IV peptidase [Streptomyces albus]AYN33147.1 prepilin peptidase [Streptomyces albus]
MSPESWLVLVALLWGAAAGWLLPRPVYRLAVPAGEERPERTPQGREFGGPFGGWLGPARAGGERYGPAAPPTAVATALVCGALAAATGTRPELGAWLLLAPVFVLLAMVDFRVQRLPDPLTLPLAGGALLLLGGAALLPEHGGDWTGALLGALALGLFFFVLFLINPRGMGFGDVKLVLSLGAVLGWYSWGGLLLGTFVGFLLGALYGVGLVALRRADRKTSIPFGPFLIAGALLGVLMGAYAA